MKHKTNNGFIDEEGNWHCWKCTKENEFFYPKGKVVANFQIPEKNIVIRIVCIGEHAVGVEAWNTKTMQRLNVRQYDYLSSALREYERLIRGYLYQEEGTERRGSRRVLEEALAGRTIIIPEVADTSDRSEPSQEVVGVFSSDTSSFTTTLDTINEVLDYLETFNNERIIFRRITTISEEENTIFLNCVLEVPGRFRIFETDNSIQVSASFSFHNCRSSDGRSLYPQIPQRVGEFLSNFMNLIHIHETTSSELLRLINIYWDQVRRRV